MIGGRTECGADGEERSADRTGWISTLIRVVDGEIEDGRVSARRSNNRVTNWVLVVDRADAGG